MGSCTASLRPGDLMASLPVGFFFCIMASSRRWTTVFRDSVTEGQRTGLNAFIATFLILLTLTIWPALYSSWSVQHDLGFSWRALVFSGLFVGGTLLWGLLPTSLVAPARSIWDLPLTIVTGSSLLSAGFMLLSFLLPIGPGVALFFLLLCGGIPAYVFARKKPDFLNPLRQTSLPCLLAIGIGLLAASAWSQTHLFAFEDAGQSVIYKPWSDGFLLAQTASLFSDWVQPQTMGRFDLSGFAVGFYHYGAYTAAGAFSGITNTPGLSAIDAFATPWSMFLVAMAAYALGKHWWGPWVGLASLAAAFLLPDASFYGFKLGRFGYYWLQQTGPSLAWGVALGACAILLIDAACRRGGLRLFFLGLCFAVITLLFKAQIAAILVPPLLLWGILFFPGIKKRSRVAIIVLTGITLALLALAATQFDRAPTLAFSGDWGARYLVSISHGVEEEATRHLWRQIAGSKWLLPQVALVVTVSLGVLPLIWLVAFIIRRVRKQSTASDWLPFFFLVMHLAVIFGLAPNTQGNRWELHHRPFVLIYFLFAAWCGGATLTLLLVPGRAFARRRRWSRARQRLIALPGLLSLLIVPLLLGNQILGEDLWFAKPFVFTSLSKDYLTCTDLIRRNAARTDVVQVSDNDPAGLTNALTERTAYLARADRHAARVQYASVAEARAADLTDLARAETMPAFESLLTRLPIRWYLLKPGADVSWPPAIASKPAFQCGAYRVYDLNEWRK